MSDAKQTKGEKMDISEMKLSDVMNLVEAFKGKGSKSKAPKDMGTRIVILQRGWVVVGNYVQTGQYVTLSKAAVVRKWGTTKGLPELAAKGPLSDPVLEKGPDIRFHALTEIASIACNEAAWSGKLEA